MSVEINQVSIKIHCLLSILIILTLLKNGILEKKYAQKSYLNNSLWSEVTQELLFLNKIFLMIENDSRKNLCKKQLSAVTVFIFNTKHFKMFTTMS